MKINKMLKPNKKGFFLKAGLTLAAAAAITASVVISKNVITSRAVARQASQTAAVDLRYQSEQQQALKVRLEERDRRSRDVSWLVGALSFVGTVLLQFLWFLLSSLVAKLTLAPITSLLGFAGDVLITFLIILALFGILFKRLYPGRKLRELYTLKNLGLFLLAALAISALKLAASLFSPNYLLYTSIIQCLLTLATLTFVWFKANDDGSFFSRQIKNHCRSANGRLVFVSLALASVVFAIIKSAVAGLAVVGSYAHVVIVFALCAALVLGVYRIVRAVQKKYDLSALLPLAGE